MTHDQTYKACDASHFTFRTTKSLKLSQEIISQDRAIRAINMGLGIRKPGYNIYVAGYSGTGKTSVIRTFLEKWSKGAPTPCDWIYVYNFEKTESPIAIKMKAGDSRKFKKDMEQLVKSLRESITHALQSEDYENAVGAYISSANEKKSKLFANLEKLSKTLDFQIKSTQMGIETIPVRDGRPITDKEYSKLDEQQRSLIEDRRTTLEPAVLDFARKIRRIENETDEYVVELRKKIGEKVVGGYVEILKSRYQSSEDLVGYLNEVQEHVIENLLDFVDQPEQTEEHREDQPHNEKRERFKKYEVNIFIDNAKQKGAPVIIESNPTYYNLFGRIEKNVEYGMYRTDFMMIKPGSIQKANGGYIVLNANDIMKTYGIWEGLKRILKTRLGFLEDIGEQHSLLPTSGLRPEPIPLDVKVILIGGDDIYHLLYEVDEEFSKIFKIKADFDRMMPRDKRNMTAYASFVATRASKEGLLHFSSSGVAAIVEHGSRMVDEQEFLSTQFGRLKDTIIESDYIAREQGHSSVERKHVELAIEERNNRLDLIEDDLSRMLVTGDHLITVDGKETGQVNGLTVYDMADYSFGRVARITCTTFYTDNGIFNIDRASKLSGKLHDKGVYILTGFLSALLGRHTKLSFSASLAFEQSYGMIDGDSATAAELIAVLSSLAEIPVRQDFAITGSLNQMGEIQPIGGVNEKISGFFKTCKLIGKGKHYSVIIPAQNCSNLMLSKAEREAVRSGFLSIYPVTHFWQAFELITGVSLGCTSVHDKTFADKSALQIIVQKMKAMNKKMQSHKHDDESKEGHF